MGGFKNLMLDIEYAVNEGKMSFREIALAYGITYEDVTEIANQLAAQYGDDDYFEPRPIAVDE